MTPEEFIRENVTIKEAAESYLLDSNFVRELMNRYANHRMEELGEKIISKVKSEPSKFDNAKFAGSYLELRKEDCIDNLGFVIMMK